MKKTSLIIFVIAVSGTLISELAAIGWLQVVCKPLIMASLFFFYLFSTEPLNRSRSVVLAIVFSFTGDVLLMQPDYFITGLIAFMSAHILYIFAYRQHRHEENENALSKIQRVRLAFPVILWTTGLAVVLFPSLGDLKIPVMFYAVVILLMVLQALFRNGYTSAVSFRMVFAGAVLFMISDSVLAINKFLTPVTEAGFFIMLTYSAAQFLIIKGLLKHPQ